MKGFMNSWAIAFLALGLLVLTFSLYSLQISFSDIHSGYATEWGRWVGDLKWASCRAKAYGFQDYTGIASRDGNKTKIHYSDSLVSINLTFVKNYPPYASFNSPSDGETIDCKSNGVYTFSWYACDPEEETVTSTLYENTNELGTTQETSLTVPCSNLTQGENTYTLKVSDPEGNQYFTSVVATVKKS